MKASVKDVEIKWLNECKFEEESLKKIKQKENEKQNLRQKVVNVTKEKELVRETRKI